MTVAKFVHIAGRAPRKGPEKTRDKKPGLGSPKRGSLFRLGPGPQESKPERRPARGDRFATTHWSMVSPLAGRKGSAEASRLAGRARRELLVPALCLRAAGRPRRRGRPGLDAGVLPPLVDQELPGGRRPAPRTLPLVPAGSDEALPGQPTRARGAETRRPWAHAFAGFRLRRESLCTGSSPQTI